MDSTAAYMFEQIEKSNMYLVKKNMQKEENKQDTCKCADNPKVFQTIYSHVC